MMNEDEIERLAELLFDRIMEKQEQADKSMQNKYKTNE